MKREIFNNKIEILTMPDNHGNKVEGSAVATLGHKFIGFARNTNDPNKYLWPDGQWYEIAFPNYNMRHHLKKPFPEGFPNGAYFDTREELVALLSKIGFELGVNVP